MEKQTGFFRRNYHRLMRFITALRLLLVNLFFVAVIVVVMVIFSVSDIPSVPKQGALLLDIQGSLVDQLSYVDPLSQLMGQADPEQQETLLQDIIDAINYGRKDKRINSMVLSLDQMSYGSISKMQELAPVLQAFRDSGKKIIAVGDYYNQQQYWMAAQADEIYLHPMGGVLLEGYSLYRSYYKQALDKLKIDFHIFRVGEYKSAMEPFMRDDMSAQAKQANLQWLGNLWQQYVNGVSERRQLPATVINDYINHMDQLLATHSGDTAAAAMASGLVDGIKSRDEINSYLVEEIGAEDEEGYYQTIGFEQYLWLQRLELSRPDKEQKIAVIVAAGNIMDGRQPAGAIGGDSLAALIRDVRLDPDIRALVLRIDSGGGSAFASEVIRRELQLLQQQGKPLVVSMGSMAASGGYWIAADADEIWATSSTLTGSIGIFAAFPTIDKSLGSLGIHADGVGTTALAGALRVDRPLQPIAARSIQSVIDNGYARFLNIVAEGRELPLDEVARLAEGRVWSGIDAKRLGLVDQLGGLDQAVDSAAKLAQLDSYQRVLIEQPLTPQEQFIKELSAGVLIFNNGFTVSSNLRGRLQSWLQPLVDSLGFVQQMNDPKSVYLHCGACVAP